MSTIAPADARRIGAELATRGFGFIDAPVTGSSPAAEDGTLTIMAGGEDEAIARAMPLLEVMGTTIVHVGALGHGQTIKLINNAVAAANATTLAQALVMGSATGVDLEALERILAAGSGSSTMVTLKAGPMRRHDYTTLFKTEHMLKDVRLCLEEAQAAGVPFPAAGSARDALVAAVGRGYADADFAALLEAFEGMAGLRIGED
jgi:3-hydroxyisobutyrate dehydrogenase-like beta-hydroxyacid dehydrogenase